MLMSEDSVTMRVVSCDDLEHFIISAPSIYNHVSVQTAHLSLILDV